MASEDLALEFLDETAALNNQSCTAFDRTTGSYALVRAILEKNIQGILVQHRTMGILAGTAAHQRACKLGWLEKGGIEMIAACLNQVSSSQGSKDAVIVVKMCHRAVDALLGSGKPGRIKGTGEGLRIAVDKAARIARCDGKTYDWLLLGLGLETEEKKKARLRPEAREVERLEKDQAEKAPAPTLPLKTQGWG
jgi:hypothetical protein